MLFSPPISEQIVFATNATTDSSGPQWNINYDSGSNVKPKRIEAPDILIQLLALSIFTIGDLARKTSNAVSDLLRQRVGPLDRPKLLCSNQVAHR